MSAEAGAGAGEPWRYERKFVVRDLDPRMVEHAIRIHPAHFREIHQQRWINNCYFDSPPLNLLRDAVQGISHRLKVRVRWYGDLFGPVSRPLLELKRKRATVGIKEHFPVPPFVFDRDRVLPPLGEWFGEAGWPDAAPRGLASLRPALVNRYSRRYFATPDNRFRLTLDSDCTYLAPSPGRERSRGLPRDPITSIIELKYAAEDELEAAQVAERLPFRMTKNSKYVNGMMRVGRR